MNRSFVSALLSLACLSTLPALAQSSGSAQPSVTLSVGANPVPGKVPVTATVQPYIGSTKIPTGTITFLDGTTVLNQGGTALTPPGGITSQTFTAAVGTLDPGLAAVAQGMITGDFDGDGKPDLLVYGTTNASVSTEVQVFLTSNAGNAHFRAVAPQTLAVPLPSYATPATLYANNDTKLDLLIGNMVAYGNGDGTFSNPAVLSSVATGFRQTYIVEGLAGSGQALVAVNAPPSPIPASGTAQYTFTVFSYSFGTFTSLGNFALAAPIELGTGCCAELNVFGLSFGDVNGDGNIDVISESNGVPVGNAATGVTFNVMLNNGDGTFGPPKPLDASALLTIAPSAIAIGDLNGDGKNDLVMTYAENTGVNYIAAALGNGDGTFGAFSTLQLINFMTAAIPNPQVQLADVNGDGNLDAVAGSGEVALGNGDGTFTLGTPFFAQPANPQTPLNYPLLQVPIDANAASSLVYLNTTSGANAVFTPQNAATVQATLALAAGSHTITAQYSGDSTYAQAVGVQNISLDSTPPTIGITASANPIYATQSVTFTATLNNPAATGTITFLDAYPGSDPLQPILNPNPTTLGTATVANGVATLTTTQLPAGLHTITAVYGDIYNPTATAQIKENVNLPFSVANSGNQISLSTTPGGSASAQISISALGGFTGPVTFGCTNSPAVCSFSPATVNLAGTSASAVTLTVTATPTPTTAQVSPSFSETVLACGIPMFALFGIASGGIASRRRQRVLFAVMAIAFCGTFCLGCGGGGSQQTSPNSLPAGNYPFYVTATSGQNEQVLTGLLTVQ
ncbi:MAG TPA: FG-GAP-like repeat-containing protein [Acidobacteriaceae bacterium]